MKEKITVLLVDDHVLVRYGLRLLLAGEPDMRVVGEAASGQEALQKAVELAPQVVLMDIGMPGMGGIEATEEIKKACPATLVIVVTMYDDQDHMADAIRAGAAGYVTKDASRELLCHSVRAAVDGGTMVGSALLRQAVVGLLRPPRTPTDAASALGASKLSPREREILRLLAQGYGNKAISAELHLAEVTIKKYVQSVIGKLGVADRTQAAVRGMRLGLVE
jgi:DNA-binding NarL/FixJ family response regulator